MVGAPPPSPGEAPPPAGAASGAPTVGAPLAAPAVSPSPSQRGRGWGVGLFLPTWRLLALVLATLIPLALTDFAPCIGILTLVLLFGVAALVAVDVRATARPDRLVVGRIVADRLSLGAE